MSDEQKSKYTKIGRILHEVFGDGYGSIEFNFAPGRDVNFVVKENVKIEKG